MTLGEVLRLAADHLAKTSETARLDAELLLAHVLGRSRIELYTDFDRPLDEARGERISRARAPPRAARAGRVHPRRVGLPPADVARRRARPDPAPRDGDRRRALPRASAGDRAARCPRRRHGNRRDRPGDRRRARGSSGDGDRRLRRRARARSRQRGAHPHRHRAARARSRPGPPGWPVRPRRRQSALRRPGRSATG